MKSKMVGIIIALLGMFHALMTVAYLAPANLLTRNIQSLVFSYMGPLFYQDWHLFSPNPGITTTEFWLRCRLSDQRWTQWLDPFAQIQAEHYANRITGRGKLLYVYRGIAKGLDREYDHRYETCSEELYKDLEKKGEREIPREKYRQLLQDRCSRSRIVEQVESSEAYKVAARFASDFCAAIGNIETTSQSFQFAVINLTPKKYSERKSKQKWGNMEERVYRQGNIVTTQQLQTMSEGKH